MKIHQLLRAAAVGITFSAGLACAAEFPIYRVEMLPMPPEADSGAWASGLNNAGDVIGSVSGQTLGTRAAQWSAGTHALTLLPFGKGQPHDQMWTSAINESGAIVGGYEVFIAVTWFGTPLRWSNSATASVVLPTTSPRRAASAVSINNAGVAVGGTWWPQSRALLWSPSGAVQDLGTLSTARSAWASAVAINDAGTVAGTAGVVNGPTQAFVWTASDGMRELPALPGSVSSEAFGINAGGEIIGRALYSGQPWRFVRWSGADAVDLGPLPIGTDASQSNIAAINAAGFVVGYFQSTAGPHGYLMARDGSIVDLADRIDPADPMKAAFADGVFYVGGINEQGVVAGTFGQNPFTRPFVLVPQP